MKKRTKKQSFVHTYTLMDELMASAKNPLPEDARRHQLSVMWEGLASIEVGAEPNTNDWRVCSDAVNLMETLILQMQICEDTNGLLADATEALAFAGKRYLEGKPLRLDGPGIHAVRSVLEDYAYMLDMLPHRTVVRCHRLTEKRMHEILQGKKKPHDVEVTEVLAL